MTHAKLRKGPRSGYRRGIAFLFVLGAMLLFMSCRSLPMFLPYLIVSYVLGGLAYMWGRRHNPDKNAPSVWDYLFPKAMWLHQSTVLDAVIASISLFVFILPERFCVFSLPLGRKLANFVAAQWPALHAGVASLPGTPILIAFTLTTMLAADLFYYISHRLMHTIPRFWEFHKVHHSAPVLTPLTLYRVHPFEWVLLFVMREAGRLPVAAAFFYFYPEMSGIFLIAGFNGFLVITYLMGADLRHTHIWLSYGRAMEHIFISPAQHQIHHSIHPNHLNKNYGSILSLWDWMFGSLYVPHGKEAITFGLGGAKEEAPYGSTRGLFIYPVRQMMKKA